MLHGAPMEALHAWLDRHFGLTHHGTSLQTELLAGLSTFLTMAYIIFVNPEILSTTGMPREAVFAATCLAAAIGSFIMGWWANYPIALAPGMGLNAYFAFVVVGTLGFSWQQALGAVFLSGLLFVLVSLFRLREWIINAIPKSLKYAISAGIGFFLAIIGLKNTGLVVAHPATLVTLGVLDAEGRLPRLGRALLADSSAIVVGALLGTSSTTAYIESAAGTAVGGRTGLTAIVVALLFLFALLFSPLAAMVPAYATAPALLFVAILMARGGAEVDWHDITEAAPAAVTAVTMPFTFSIAHGIAFGFITYAAVKLLAGGWRELSPMVAVITALFLVKFAFW